VNRITGKVIEVGNIESLGDKPGLVIETTMEQLMAQGRNIAYAQVEVRLIEVEETNHAVSIGGTPYPERAGSDLPWSVVHPDAGNVGLRTPRFATEAEALAQAAKWNRDYAGLVVIGLHEGNAQ
jgi:hypothetical protein